MDLEALQEAIGYRFENANLLAQALTHPSLSYESQRAIPDNQRLEFLGDAVLQLTLSHLLFARLPKAAEGELSEARAQLVSKKALAELARVIHLGGFIRMGRSETIGGGRKRESALADAFEAVLGAVYLDGGLAAASDLVQRFFEAGVTAVEIVGVVRNPKGQLQEFLQAINGTAPVYCVTAHSGPDHAKSYEVTVSWENEVLGQGVGRSKKEAELQAAQQALNHPRIAEGPARPPIPSSGKPAGNPQPAGNNCTKISGISEKNIGD